MGLIKWIGTFTMLAVFALSIITYVTYFGDDNNAYIRLSNDSRISTPSSEIQSQLNIQKIQVEESSKAFTNATIESGDETTTTGGVFKAIRGVYNSGKTTLNMTSSVLFGGKGQEGRLNPGIILTALGTFFVVVTILLIWKTWAGKNPE